jgi:hypothetical protein
MKTPLKATIGFLIGFVATLWFIWSVVPETPCPVTAAKASRIRKGMTLAVVERLLGERTGYRASGLREGRKTEPKDLPNSTHEWQGHDVHVVVWLDGQGRVEDWRVEEWPQGLRWERARKDMRTTWEGLRSRLERP